MTLKKRILSAAAGVGSLYFALATAAYAQLSIIITPPDVGFSDIGQLIQIVINWSAALGAVATLLFIIVGAFQYITAGDDVKKTGAARQTITNGVIGLVIIASAWGIFQLVVNMIPGLNKIIR